MSNQSLTIATPIVSIRNGTVFANSRDVAEFFGKEHRVVLKAIDSTIDALAGGVHHFVHTPIINEQNGVAYRTFNMTRDGFTLLAMGFTGKKALQFKLQYIEAFNRMEAKFKTAQPVPADNHGLLMKLVSQQTETNRLLRALVEGNQSVTSAVQAVQQALPKPKDGRMLSAREAQNEFGLNESTPEIGMKAAEVHFIQIEAPELFSGSRAGKYMRVAKVSKSVNLYDFEGGMAAFLEAHATPRSAKVVLATDFGQFDLHPSRPLPMAFSIR